MPSKKLFVALFVPMLAVAAQRVDLSTSDKTDFAPGGTVRIENSTGELNVEGWDHPFVEIRTDRYAAPDTVIPGGIKVHFEDATLIIIDKPPDLLTIASEA